MAQPTMGLAGQRLYEKLGPLADPDEAHGWALAIWADAFAAMLEPVAQLVSDDEDGVPGYATHLFAPDDEPAEWLPVTEQFVGVSPYPAVDEAGRRLRIKETDGRYRGTVRGTKGAARQFLRAVGPPVNLYPNPSGELAVKGNATSPDFLPTREASGTNGIPAFSGSYRDKHAYDGTSSGDTNIDAYTMAVPSAGPYVVSLYVWVPSSWDGSTVNLSSDASFAGASADARGAADLSKRDQWQRIYTTLTIAAGDLAGVFVLRYTGAAPSSVGTGVIYTDALMIESGSTPSAYFDGDSPGHKWTGAEHASRSGLLQEVGTGYVAVLQRNGGAYRYAVVVRQAEVPEDALTALTWDQVSGTWDAQADEQTWKPSLLFDALAEQKPAHAASWDLIVSAGQLWDEVTSGATWNAASATVTWDDLYGQSTL